MVVTHQSGLTVAESTDLRRQVRAAGASFKVTKNRLTRLALEGTKPGYRLRQDVRHTELCFGREVARLDPVALRETAEATGLR